MLILENSHDYTTFLINYRQQHGLARPMQAIKEIPTVFPCFVAFYHQVDQVDRYSMHCVKCSRSWAKKLVYKRKKNIDKPVIIFYPNAWFTIHDAEELKRYKADIERFSMDRNIIRDGGYPANHREFTELTFDEYPVLLLSTTIRSGRERNEVYLKTFFITIQKAKKLIYLKKNKMKGFDRNMAIAARLSADKLQKIHKLVSLISTEIKPRLDEWIRDGSMEIFERHNSTIDVGVRIDGNIVRVRLYPGGLSMGRLYDDIENQVYDNIREDLLII